LWSEAAISQCGGARFHSSQQIATLYAAFTGSADTRSGDENRREFAGLVCYLIGDASLANENLRKSTRSREASRA
jgi:hypothetical protein